MTKSEAIDKAIMWAKEASKGTNYSVSAEARNAYANVSLAWSTVAALLPEESPNPNA